MVVFLSGCGPFWLEYGRAIEQVVEGNKVPYAGDVDHCGICGAVHSGTCARTFEEDEEEKARSGSARRRRKSGQVLQEEPAAMRNG